MQPQENHELPPIAMPEQGLDQVHENPYASHASETPASMAMEQSQPSAASSGPAAAQATGPLPLVPPAPAPSASKASGPAIADDVDLIEKEWVTKAKEIVERTRDDPRRQNQEMNHMKADYMMKRYNKEIKLDES